MPESYTFEELAGAPPGKDSFTFEELSQPKPDEFRIAPGEQGVEVISPSEVLSYPLKLAGKAALGIANIPTRIANWARGAEPWMPNYVEPLTPESSTPQIPTIPEMPNAPKALQYGAGLANLGIKTVQSVVPPFAKPDVGLLAPLALGPGLVGRLATTAFAAPTLASVPEQIGEAVETVQSPTATPMQKAEAVGQPAVSTLFGGAALAHGSGILPRAKAEALKTIALKTILEIPPVPMPEISMGMESGAVVPLGTGPTFDPSGMSLVQEAPFSSLVEASRSELSKPIVSQPPRGTISLTPELLAMQPGPAALREMQFEFARHRALQKAQGSPFMPQVDPGQEISMGPGQKSVAELGTPPTFDPSGQRLLGTIGETVPEGREFVQRMGRAPTPEELKQIQSGQIEFQERPDKIVEAQRALEEQQAQKQRTEDFAKAISERVSQEQEPPLHPDRALTENQLRIIKESLVEAVLNNQIPGSRQGIIAGSALEKWADEKIAKAGEETRFSINVDPSLAAAGIVKGVALLERGITELARWSAEMVREFGPQIGPHLKRLYEQSKNLRASNFGKTEERPVAPSTAPTKTTPSLAMASQQGQPTATGPAAPPQTGLQMAGQPQSLQPTPAPPKTGLLAKIRASVPSPGDIRERFRPIERNDSPGVARWFTDVVNVGRQAETVVQDFMRRSFKGGDAEALAKKFVALGRDNRRLELQSRGIQASQIPALTPTEAANIRADSNIQRAIALWNSEIAPMIEDIRTRNGMIMSPSWNSMDLMLNLPGEYSPVNQGIGGSVNLRDVYNRPAVGEGSYQTDPVEALRQIVRGHLRYDAASRLSEAIKKDVSIPPQTVVDPLGKLSPSTFPAPRRGQWFEAPYKGKMERVEPINLNPNESAPPDYHYVPKRVADQFNKLYQERGNYNTWADKVLGSILQFGVLPGTFLPHVVREISAVSARIAQSGQSMASLLPSWLGSHEKTIRRLSQMKDSAYGQVLQRMLDKSGADRGIGFGIADAKTKLGKLLKLPHELLFNPNYGIDVLARRAIADAHLRMQFGNKAIDQLEEGLKSGNLNVTQGLSQLQPQLSDADVLSLGRRVNNTMGYANPQTRTATLNWVQRALPFISSESGKIPDEIRRLITLNLDASALKKSLARDQYGQAAKQIGGMLANGAIGVYILQNALNQMTTKAATGKGQPMSENPEGRKTDVFIAPGWFWSNLDPGLARAARLTGAKELTNTGKAPDVGREAVNEAMSVLHPAIRLAFSALMDKTMYFDQTGKMPSARRSDLIPFGPARHTLNAAALKRPIGSGVIKDAASVGGVQLVGNPPKPEAIRGAKLNDYVDTIARKARQIPLEHRRDYVDGLMLKVPEDFKFDVEKKLKRKGLYRHDIED